MSVKEIFGSISLSVIQFLENHQGVTNVQFFQVGGCSQTSINDWEQVLYKCFENLSEFTYCIA